MVWAKYSLFKALDPQGIGASALDGISKIESSRGDVLLGGFYAPGSKLRIGRVNRDCMGSYEMLTRLYIRSVYHGSFREFPK